MFTIKPCKTKNSNNLAVILDLLRGRGKFVALLVLGLIVSILGTTSVRERAMATHSEFKKSESETESRPLFHQQDSYQDSSSDLRRDSVKTDSNYQNQPLPQDQLSMKLSLKIKKISTLLAKAEVDKIAFRFNDDAPTLTKLHPTEQKEFKGLWNELHQIFSDFEKMDWSELDSGKEAIQLMKSELVIYAEMSVEKQNPATTSMHQEEEIIFENNPETEQDLI